MSTYVIHEIVIEDGQRVDKVCAIYDTLYFLCQFIAAKYRENPNLYFTKTDFKDVTFYKLKKVKHYGEKLLEFVPFKPPFYGI